jgi:hypothetical protein
MSAGLRLWLSCLAGRAQCDVLAPQVADLRTGGDRRAALPERQDSHNRRSATCLNRSEAELANTFKNKKR